MAMDGPCSKAGTIILGLVLAGCSLQGTLDKLVSRERQAELVSAASAICFDREAATRHLHPEIVDTVRNGGDRLTVECPGEKARWRLVSYQWNTNITNGLTQRQEEAVVVGTGTGKWSTVALRFYGENGAPLKIVEWNIAASTAKPPALIFAEDFDKTARTMRIAVPAGLLLIGGIVGGLIWRRRKQRRVG
jgi:hypothetical protein